MNDAARHWLKLWRAPGIGPQRFAELIHAHGSPAAVAEAAARGRLAGLPEAARDFLCQADEGALARALARDLAWLAASPLHHLLTWDDPRYPARLREIADAPPLLFVHGDPAALGAPLLAVVGSRNATPAGRETAFAFARHLAAQGLGIVSGLALGIDAAAHSGALDGAGITVAVCGTGPDEVYPRAHRALAARIVEAGGALVTEFPTGTVPRPENFPRRNRILSGLGLGVLVVEAGVQSGSLITARLAGEQGREVFAIPGSIHNPLARGCHALIRQGAKLVETAQDIAEELGAGWASVTAVDARSTTPPRGPAQTGPDPDHARVLAALGFEPTPVDLLVARTGLTPESVSSILLILELQGKVAAATAGGYQRTGSGEDGK